MIKKQLISIYLKHTVDRIDRGKNIENSKLKIKKNFYVISSKKKRGFFSLLLFVLNHIDFANKKKLIPIIDMKYHPTLYNEKKTLFSTNNSWEYYFNKINRYNIDEVYQSKKYVICKDKNIITKNNKFNLYLKPIYNRHIKIKKNIYDKYLFYKKRFFKKDDKFLGVHFRGTDMKYTPDHPLPMTKKQVNKNVHFLMKKHNLNKIFLITEDIANFSFFKNHLNEYDVYYINNFRTSKTRVFDRNYRKNHRFKMGEEALINSLLLSNCKFILSTQTGITDFARFYNKSIKYKKINNGNNSKKILLSLFKYHFKDIMPEYLGGFKV